MSLCKNCKIWNICDKSSEKRTNDIIDESYKEPVSSCKDFIEINNQKGN